MLQIWSARAHKPIGRLFVQSANQRLVVKYDEQAGRAKQDVTVVHVVGDNDNVERIQQPSSSEYAATADQQLDAQHVQSSVDHVDHVQQLAIQA